MQAQRISGIETFYNVLLNIYSVWVFIQVDENQ